MDRARTMLHRTTPEAAASGSAPTAGQRAHGSLKMNRTSYFLTRGAIFIKAARGAKGQKPETLNPKGLSLQGAPFQLGLKRN